MLSINKVVHAEDTFCYRDYINNDYINNDFYYHNNLILIYDMCYPPTGYIMFSLKKLKFYGAGGRITQTPSLNNEMQKVKNVFIFERWTGH